MGKGKALNHGLFFIFREKTAVLFGFLSMQVFYNIENFNKKA